MPRLSGAMASRRRKARSRDLTDLEVEAGKIECRRYDRQMRHRGRHDNVAHRRFGGEHVVDGEAAVAPIDAEAGGGVGLRIEIDDQYLLVDGGERSAEIDRGGGLADAAFLIGDREHAGDLGFLRADFGGERRGFDGRGRRRRIGRDRGCGDFRLGRPGLRAIGYCEFGHWRFRPSGFPGEVPLPVVVQQISRRLVRRGRGGLRPGLSLVQILLRRPI